MEFLNNYTCRIMNSCDLIGMLGGFLACVLCISQNRHCEEHSDEAIHKINYKKYCRPEFSSGPIQRRIDIFNVNQFLNKFYKSSRPEQSTSCHCEQSEAIHSKQYGAICHCEELCDEAIHETNYKKYCRPEFISGPIPCGAEKLNLKDKFFTLLAGKMLWKTRHFSRNLSISEKVVNQVQHDMFFCHCEQSEAIHNPQESRGVKCQ